MLEWLPDVMRQAHRLAEEERDEEALRVLTQALEEPDLDELDPHTRMSIENNVAWLLAHVGRSSEAVALAEELFHASGSAQQPRARATLGIALAAAGRHMEALDFLTDTVARGISHDAWNLTAHHFWRGEALAGLGRTTEARVAWNEAIAVDPRSRYARRAEARLVAPASPYRGG